MWGVEVDIEGVCGGSRWILRAYVGGQGGY